MAALVRIAANLRAVLAAHVALHFVDRRRLRTAHNVERNGLVRVAAKAPDFATSRTLLDAVASIVPSSAISLPSTNAMVLPSCITGLSDHRAGLSWC
jgi:hypothetical protein